MGNRIEFPDMSPAKMQVDKAVLEAKERLNTAKQSLSEATEAHKAADAAYKLTLAQAETFRAAYKQIKEQTDKVTAAFAAFAVVTPPKKRGRKPKAAATGAAVPKKRGRKPKAEAAATTPKNLGKPKRGRKPKAEKVAAAAAVVPQKKRGRKPKADKAQVAKKSRAARGDTVVDTMIKVMGSKNVRGEEVAKALVGKIKSNNPPAYISSLFSSTRGHFNKDGSLTVNKKTGKNKVFEQVSRGMYRVAEWVHIGLAKKAETVSTEENTSPTMPMPDDSNMADRVLADVGMNLESIGAQSGQ